MYADTILGLSRLVSVTLAWLVCCLGSVCRWLAACGCLCCPCSG
nr:MAG TPA: hypothetical protein [Caudoviricetes sp.]